MQTVRTNDVLWVRDILRVTGILQNSVSPQYTIPSSKFTVSFFTNVLFHFKHNYRVRSLILIRESDGTMVGLVG